MAEVTVQIRGRSVERERMVASQVARRGVTDERVLDTMRQVPREVFVGVGMEEFAYEDSPLPIAAGQTISQPYIVALMIAAAQIKPSDRVLDVGTGSGYAAAVLSRLAAKVYSIERHRELANSARRALERLGYNNVEVRHGDGTLGWADAAPFDAILVAAGGPEIPEALRRQLKIGGRLVIPIGELGGTQELVKVIRDGEDRFHEEDLGPVTFVPLIGEAGWQEPAVDAAPAFARLWPRRPVVRAPSATELIRQAAEPLPELDNPAFGAMFDRFAKARVVLLGEATHGTSEFYRARAQITRRLIEQHGFNIVAVEADWPDAARIDRYIRHKAVHVGSGPAFRRFPQWIWRNVEVANFVDWLRAHNAALHPGEHAGFFGLDIYNMNASIEAVIGYLDRFDPEAAAIAKERYGCLTPWQRDPATYGRAALTTGYAKCEQPVLLALRDLLNKQLEYGSQDRDSFLDAAQNARLVASAERYYRAMYYATAESWNLRDRHMFETLNNLMEWRGADAKAVVWAHNSHVGNAAATDMGRARDEINIGQLCREKFGDDAALIGFGTDRGTVAAADDWDGPMKVKTVRPAHPESYEYLCKDTGIRRFLLDLRKGQREELRSSLMSARLERAIGVIYRPETELASHYFDAHLPAQFDGYVWFEETRAVKPLPAERQPGLPETYPFGL
ncbi:protein-L-isoaspartate(D-aspartate) O-methyltransferase [Bradyrhizobium sp.]|uniref:protein-L-isoaspartate(D-aspartate) O-methyltransferase n=1 Tax=Bradyrhizobium sp. TaxID=376 RepID=UPI002618EF2C|nr:protein-L-isoaspartate(D-aspartate) O-methyltransferase [Bradyrhizobium sp.]